MFGPYFKNDWNLFLGVHIFNFLESIQCSVIYISERSNNWKSNPIDVCGQIKSLIAATIMKYILESKLLPQIFIFTLTSRES